MISLEKTGYERKGFDDVEVFPEGIGIVGKEWKDNGKKYTPEGFEDNDKTVDLSTDWLRKHARQVGYINTSCSSYSLKHIIEKRIGEYISNGATIKAAISEGYEYIITGDGPNAFFNLGYTVPNNTYGYSENSNNDQPLNAYGNLMDQEDYNDRVRSIVSQEYSEKCGKEWVRLSKKLLFDWGYQWWLDLGWDTIIDNPSKCHPFWRIIMYNIITVIRAIHSNGIGGLGYFNDYAYERLAINMISDVNLPYKEMERILKDNPKINTLYESLPFHFKYTNTFNDRYIGLTLPKSRRLVDYMFSRKFSETMQGFVKLFGEVKPEPIGVRFD